MLGKIQKDFIKFLLLFGGLFIIIYLGFLLMARTSDSIWLLNHNNTHLLSYEKEIKFICETDKSMDKNFTISLF